MKNKICIISLVTMIIIAISTTSFGFGLNMSFNKIDKINVGDEIILTINFSEDIIGATLKINYDNNNLELLGSQTDDLTVANKDGKVSCVYFEIVKRGTNTLKVKFKVKSITNNIMSFNMEDAKFVTKLNEKTYTQNKEIKASITINKGDNSENDNTTKDDTNKDNNSNDDNTSNDDTKQDNSSEDNNTSNDDVNKDDNSNNSNDNKTPDKDISDDNNGDTDDIPDTDIDDDKNNIDDDTDDDLQDDTNKDNTTNDNKNNNDNNTSNNNRENKDNNLNDNNNVKNNNTNQNNVKNNNSNTTNTNNIKGNDLTNSKSNTKDNNSNNKTVSIKNMPFTGTYAILYIAIVLAVIVTIVAGLRIKTKAKDFEDKYDK